MTDLKHTHGPCVACLHKYAHGLWDGYSAARVVLMKAGLGEAVEAIDAPQARAVTREVRKIGNFLGIPEQDIAKLLRHHGAAVGK